jgi:hypothetical protein
VIGKPSSVPLLAEINDQLPAPFDFETETASERNMQVIYRIPSGMSVGYLELLHSPYNAEKPILVLSGNSDDGLVMAGDALQQNQLSSQLAGVFAVTNGTQIATGSASSAFSAVGTLVPADQAILPTPMPVPQTAYSTLQPPAWLLPLLIASGIGIVLIILLVMVNAFSRKRAETARSFSPPNHKTNGKSEDQ